MLQTPLLQTPLLQTPLLPARRWAPVLAAAILALGVGRPASAQSDPKGAEAKKQFEAGIAAMNGGDLKRARELLLASLGIVAKANTVYNLADCEEKLGLLAAASRHFEEALALLPVGDDRRPTFDARITAIAPRVPHLTITLPSEAPEGTRVLLDGEALGPEKIGREIALDPGKHEVTVQAPGRPDKAYPVDLAEKQRLDLSAAPADGASGGGSGALRIAGFVTVGVGVAGLAAWGVTGVLALEKKDALQRLCPDLSRCVIQGEARAREGRDLAAVSTVAFAAGLAAVGAGTTMILLGRPRSVAVQASAGPTGGGLSLQATF